MTSYYNENNPHAAAWLRELIHENLIAPGHVDERSITDVQGRDLDGFEQCHFFAGIGGWSHALRLAGWDDARPVWTGSCPCQPFSCIGKRKGAGDKRHLWPEFARLIWKCDPPVVFGEQVASKDGRLWLAGVRAGLEGMGYSVGCSDLCAAGIGAPHIRQRLYWVAYGEGIVFGRAPQARNDSGGNRSQQEGLRAQAGRRSSAGDFWLGIPFLSRLEGFSGHGDDGDESRRNAQDSAGSASATGTWSDFDVVHCRDGRSRRVEPGTFPLVDGVPASVVNRRASRLFETALFREGACAPDPKTIAAFVEDEGVGRMMLLHGYGNAIVPELAAEFILAAEEARRLTHDTGNAL